MSQTLPIPHSSKKGGDCRSAQVQELNDLKECLKIVHEKYSKYKILYDCVQDAVSQPKYLDSELRVKVQDILLGNSCAQVVDLEGNGFSPDSNVLLGLTNLNDKELNYNESSTLKRVLEEVLQNKYKYICTEFYKITGENIGTISSESNNLGDFSLSNEDQALLSLKRKVEEQQTKYLHNLLKQQEVLEDLIKLRLEKLPQVCNDKVKECEVKSQMSQLQTKIVKEKARVDIFMETSNSLPAYEELIKDIKDQQEECWRDIQYLQKLKEKYKQVACKQYDELLKSFIQYKSSLEKKKMIYESLHIKTN